MTQDLLFNTNISNKLSNLEEYVDNLHENTCHNCRLGKILNNRGLIYRGSLYSTIAIISKCPAEKELEEGQAMVGPGGKELDKWLKRAGVVDKPFITNVVQCTPPITKSKRIRDPKIKGEIDRCFPRVKTILESMPNLEVIIAVGALAHGVLLEWASSASGSLQGNWFLSDIVNQPIFCLPHPADFLDEKTTWDGSKYGKLLSNLDKFKREYINSKRILDLAKNTRLPI